MFLETEGYKILSILQYLRVASQAVELRTPGFLQAPFCFLLPCFLPCPVRCKVSSPTSPARSGPAHPQLTAGPRALWHLRQPALSNLNKQNHKTQRERTEVAPALLQLLWNCNRNYFWHFFPSLSLAKNGQRLASYQERKNNCLNFSFHCSMFLAAVTTRTAGFREICKQCQSVPCAPTELFRL